ncbi:BTB/POZ domain-containing protein 9-like [Oppia nitens]|uniref:BTB/POZ domain-containing protein 9-like n=1 Tax=Oppia nitens TaxID=1686743 RepID=UPI0023D9AABE|nr:BTB/POZ domain-containing protein 9-like [Oppia nitens]
MMSYLAKRARIESVDDHKNGAAVGGQHSAATVDHKEQLLLHIHELYLRKDFADIEFIFGPDTVYGHKCILAVNSKWRHLLSDESRVDMEDTPIVAFKELLRYLYTGQLDLEDYEPDMLSEIRQLAERFDMDELLRPIEDRESLTIDMNNCVQIFGENEVDSQLGRQCLAFIAHNTQDIFYADDFYELDVDHIVAVFNSNDLNVTEQLVFEAAKRYISGSGARDVDKRRVLSAVRFSLLPYDYIWTTVRRFFEEKKLMSFDELSAMSAAKAKLTDHKPEVRNRAHCLTSGADVVALRGKYELSTRVLRGKIGDLGEEANTLELDLGLYYLVNGFGVWMGSSTKARFAFKMETSLDGRLWQTLYDFTKYHTSNKLELTFDPLVLRYIRVSEMTSYADWAENRKELVAKPIRRLMNIVGAYQEPTGVVRLREHLLSSKYLFQDMACDFIYKSWYKKNNKNFYVCAFNDPIVCILSQPVWMDTISLSLPDDEEEREYNFLVEISADPEVQLTASSTSNKTSNNTGSRESSRRGGDKVAPLRPTTAKRVTHWLTVGDFRDEGRKGDVEVTFEPTIVNVFRITGTNVQNSKDKIKQFAVEIRL